MFDIKIAGEEHLEAVVEMLHKFHMASPYTFIPWDAYAAMGYVCSIMDNGALYVAIHGENVIGCLGFDYGCMPFNNDYFFYLEKFMYVAEEHRSSCVASNMMAYAEYDLGSSDTASAIVLSSLSTSPPGVESWYESLGYRKVESGYIKEI